MPNTARTHPLNLLNLSNVYPGYQFYARIRYTDGRNSYECIKAVSQQINNWVESRVRNTIGLENLFAVLETSNEAAKVINYAEGFSIDEACILDDKAWAMRLREPDGGDKDNVREPVVGRFFVTQTGMKCVNDTWVDLGIKITVLEPIGDIEPIHHAYRPGFVRKLFESPLFEIEQITPITKQPTYITSADELQELEIVITEQENQLPAVILTPVFYERSIDELLSIIDAKIGLSDAEESLSQYYTKRSNVQYVEIEEPTYPYNSREIAGELFAYSRVYEIKREIYDAFSQLCNGYDKSIQPGDVVIFYPCNHEERVKVYSHKEHLQSKRIFGGRTQNIFELIKAYSKEHTAFFHQVSFFDELKEQYQKYRLNELHKKNQQSMDEWLMELDKYQEEKNKEITEWTNKYNRMKAQNIMLRQLKSKLQKGNNPLENEISNLLSNYPEDHITIAKIFKRLYGDRIDFTERAWDTLEKCTTSPKILWDAFNAIVSVLWGLYTEESSKDVVKEFNSNTRFELGLGQGKQTNKDDALMEKRRDNYEGREIMAEAHVKKGIKDNDPYTVRIYHAYIPESQKIIISYCKGDHLENFSTRKAKN